MRGFDVLDPALPLFENHFIEASAGTGKTFAIENLVLRLLHEGVSLDQILVVTFTRAATVELKERIRRQLTPEQLSQFDEARIWTIHSFCFHCLQEHALQTGFSFDQIEESAHIDLLKQIIKDGLRTSTSLTLKQLEKAINGDPEALVNQLVMLTNHRQPLEQPDWDYRKELFSLPKVDPDKLLEDLLVLAPRFGKLCDCQKRVKPDIVAGLKRFTSLIAGASIDPVDLPIIKFTEENKLKRTSPVSLHYPGFLERLQKSLIPKLLTFSSRKAIMAALAEEIRHHLERVIEEEDLIFFEDLLLMMAKQVKDPAFAENIRAQYRTVLIDEFQDTDPLQWTIFSTLFLTDRFHGPLYLVGDPKQSIYRFRRADLYTYLEAKKEMGEASHVSLQTNYRSTPSLVEALNRLFSKPFITLPKTGEILPCPPVNAASTLSPLSDRKGSLHYLLAKDEKTLFSTIVHEIARLGLPLHECAVLVSDRFQAARFIKACPLPTVSKKSRSLLDSPAFEVLLELIHAVQNPRDRSAILRVLAGPLFQCPLDALPEDYERFYRYHHLLRKEGILRLFQTVVEESSLSDPQLYQDLLQLVEMDLSLKEDYLSFYHGLMQLDPDAEPVRARATLEEEAIQVMTIHVSKGLEFSVVFPIGLLTPYKRGERDAEEDAEKMRQLYVACTRAKKRLYLPVLENHSPLSTFLKDVDVCSDSYENCQLYPPPTYQKKTSESVPKPLFEKSYKREEIYSYSSLATYEPEKKDIPKDILPPGAETGTLIHQLFEKLNFRETHLLTFVQKELEGTFLASWSDEVATMIDGALQKPLPVAENPFALADVDPNKIIKEMEFLYSSKEPSGFFKGFIDLFFEHEGGIYLVDWKTNYVDTTLTEIIQKHQYDLQAAIYQKAAKRYLGLFQKKPSFKGVFYLFLRTQEWVSFNKEER